MEDLFLWGFIICCLMLPIGLINPKFAIFGTNLNKNRKNVLKIYGTGVVLSFILFGVFCEPVETSDILVSNQQKEAEEQAKKETEEQAKKETEERAKKETEEQAKKEAEEQAKKEAEEQAKKEAEEQFKKSLDELQLLYIQIQSDMSYEEVLDLVIATGLPYSETKFNGSKAIKVAFEKEVTPQRYADSGDYVDISFTQDRTTKEYSFGTVEYFNSEKFITAFEYKAGTYWDFINGEDVGFYINDYQSTLAKTKEEKYIQLNSKEEQIKYIKQYIKK